MKKIMNAMVLLTATTIFQCCSADDPLTDNSNNATWNGNNANNGTANNSSSATAASGEVLTFSVAIDKTTAEPASTVSEYFPEEEDNLDNNAFTTEVAIDLSNPVAKEENGVTVTVDGGHITANHGTTKSVCYVVSGTTQNGSFTVAGDKKYMVQLNSVSITNPDSAALNLLSSKRAFIVINGSNTLSDGTTSKNDHKGALYCKGKLLLNGTGQLEVYGNYNNAIHSADYIIFRKGMNVYAKSTANNGIKANDGIFINGGIVNVEVTATAAKGINCESNIIVNGGRTTVITTGGGTYDSTDRETKASAGISCDSTYTQNGGEVYLKSTGNGGKGLKTDYEAYITGGTMRIITTGGLYSSNGDTSSPKGMKIGTKNVHGLLNISGGDIMVRTEGQNGEGIESKGTLTISGGNVNVSAYDDGINSAGNMYLLGGNITAVGRSSDGIDTNGNMYIEGGTIVAFGAGGAESGIDTGEQYKLYITGGQLFGIGGRIDAAYTTTDGAQPYAQTTGGTAANATVTLSNGSTTLATFTMPPYSYGSGTIIVSAPGMTSGTSYTLNLGSSTKTVTATTSSSNSGMGGMPGGGRW